MKTVELSQEKHMKPWVMATGAPGGLGLPTFLLSKYFFYIIVKENIIIDHF